MFATVPIGSLSHICHRSESWILISPELPRRSNRICPKKRSKEGTHERRLLHSLQAGPHVDVRIAASKPAIVSAVAMSLVIACAVATLASPTPANSVAARNHNATRVHPHRHAFTRQGVRSFCADRLPPPASQPPFRPRSSAAQGRVAVSPAGRRTR